MNGRKRRASPVEAVSSPVRARRIRPGRSVASDMGRSTREIFDFLVRFGPFGEEVQMDHLRQRQTDAAATARDDPPAIRADSAGGPGEPGRPAGVAGRRLGPGRESGGGVRDPHIPAQAGISRPDRRALSYFISNHISSGTVKVSATPTGSHITARGRRRRTPGSRDPNGVAHHSPGSPKAQPGAIADIARPDPNGVTHHSPGSPKASTPGMPIRQKDPTPTGSHRDPNGVPRTNGSRCVIIGLRTVSRGAPAATPGYDVRRKGAMRASGTDSQRRSVRRRSGPRGCGGLPPSSCTTLVL